jgi:uncharacterized RDD family membrane protein YckC
MAVIKIPTNFNIDLEFQIPEFYKRILALLIDIVLEYFYIRLAIRLFASISGSMDNDYDLQAIGLLLSLPLLIYHPVMEITMNGQSIGKKITGIRVVNERGGRPSISQFLIRWLLRVSDLWIAILLIIVASASLRGTDAETIFVVVAALSFLITDIILVISSQKSQRIGDILARTILINVRTKGNIEETVFQEVAENYVPSFPEIMKLTDRDINAVKSILATARKKSDYRMAEVASNKIKSHLDIHTDISPFDFLEIVMKDYNYLSTK